MWIAWQFMPAPNLACQLAICPVCIAGRILVFSTEPARFHSLRLNWLHTPPAKAGTPNGVNRGILQKTELRPTSQRLGGTPAFKQLLFSGQAEEVLMADWRLYASHFEKSGVFIGLGRNWRRNRPISV